MLKHFIPLILVMALGTSTQVFAQTKPDSAKKVNYAAVPMINYNRTQGVILGAMGSAYYKANRNDTISPASNTGLMGIYTAKQTWVVGIGQQFYLKQDTWRIRAFLFKGNVNYQYFNDDESNDAGQYEKYSNDIAMAVLQVQRKIWNRIYGGLYFEYNSTKTYFTAHNDSLDQRKLNNIGYIFTNDSRDNVYFPTRGMFLNFKSQFYRLWLGSDNNFIRYDINYNQFFDLLQDHRHILIARLNLNIATGDVPFQGQGVVGRDDIRGYSQGKYRGNQIYALQSEYRWLFNRSKFGVVGFLGVASAVDNFSDMSFSGLLPGGGVGLRYRLIPSMKVNIGVDAGVGKDDYSITFRIGESFGR
jgi:outer membrane protein assembly factor BamA